MFLITYPRYLLLWYESLEAISLYPAKFQFLKDQLSVGLIAQLVVRMHCTGITEVMSLNLVHA